MASKNFICKDCGNSFSGGPATRTCPVCGSSNIKVGGNGGGIPKWVKILAVVIAAIIVIILLLKSCKGCGGLLTASLDDTSDPMFVKIELSGKSNVSAYKVQILNGTELVETIGFPARSNVATFDKIRMLVGNCYNFRIVTKDGKPADVRWKTKTQYCPELPPPAPVFGEIKIEVDRDRKVYRVTFIIADTSSADYYALRLTNDASDVYNWQSSNIFDNVIPGNYVAYAKNETGIGEHPVFLKEIKDLPKPLTLQEIQSVLDAVSNGKVSPSGAQDKLADGNVDLKRPIVTPDGGSISTLWSLLMEASQGTRFRVRGFQNDPNTNKIQSHSLDVSLQ